MGVLVFGVDFSFNSVDILNFIFSSIMKKTSPSECAGFYKAHYHMGYC